MIITDCFWEFENLGLKTISFDADIDDVFNKDCFNTTVYEYLVARIPAGKADFIFGLPEIGFVQVESQFSISKTFSSIDFSNALIKSLEKKIDFKEIETIDDLGHIFEKMTKNMFTTDRICLDPKMGPEMALKRYKNWMKTELKEKNLIILQVNIRGINVGFSMFKIKGDKCFVYLGGIYEDYQKMGIGLLTPLSPAFYMRKNNITCRLLETQISSNNYPVIELYNYLGYKLDKVTNVFVKHAH